MSAGARLRAMTSADVEQVLGWRNHPKVQRYMPMPQQTLAGFTQWFDKTTANRDAHLLMLDVDNDARGFMHIARSGAGAVAAWGFYAAPDAPPGTGQLLCRLALDHAFNTLQLHKMCGVVLATNLASVRCHEKLGFRREGVLRQQVYDGTRYLDSISFGLLAAEYPGTRNRLPEIGPEKMHFFVDMPEV